MNSNLFALLAQDEGDDGSSSGDESGHGGAAETRNDVVRDVHVDVVEREGEGARASYDASDVVVVSDDDDDDDDDDDEWAEAGGRASRRAKLKRSADNDFPVANVSNSSAAATASAADAASLAASDNGSEYSIATTLSGLGPRETPCPRFLRPVTHWSASDRHHHGYVQQQESTALSSMSSSGGLLQALSASQGLLRSSGGSGGMSSSARRGPGAGSAAAGPGWADLPPEMLILVLHYLRGTDLAAAEGVCRSWRAMTVHWSETARELFLAGTDLGGSSRVLARQAIDAGRHELTDELLDRPDLVAAREVRRSIRRRLWHDVCLRAGFIAEGEDGDGGERGLISAGGTVVDMFTQYREWRLAQGASSSLLSSPAPPDVAVTVGNTSVSSHGRVDYRALYHASAGAADSGPRATDAAQRQLLRDYRVPLLRKPLSFSAASFARTWQNALPVVRDLSVLRLARGSEGGEGDSRKEETEDVLVLWSRVHGGVLCEIPFVGGGEGGDRSGVDKLVPQPPIKDFSFQHSAPAAHGAWSVVFRGVEISGVGWVCAFARHRDTSKVAAPLGEPREALKGAVGSDGRWREDSRSMHGTETGSATALDSCFRVTAHAFSQALHRYQLASGEIQDLARSSGTSDAGQHGAAGWKPPKVVKSSRQRREEKNLAKRLHRTLHQDEKPATDHNQRTGSTDERARTRRSERKNAKFGADRDLFS